MLWFLLLFVVLVWVIVRRFKNNRIIQMSNKIKCDLKSYPFIGHTYMAIGDGADRMRAIQAFGREAIKQGGLTGAWIAEKYLVVVVDPVDLEVIMKTALEKDDLKRFLMNITGNGSIFAPVPIWRPRRKILAPLFSPKNLNNFVEIFSRQSGVMVEQLRSIAGKGPMSVWSYVTSYTMDSVCETALDVKVNAQKKIDEPFLNALEVCVKLVAERFGQPWLHSDAMYRLLPYHNTFKRCMKVINGFIDQVIKLKRETMTESKSDLKKKPTHNIQSFLELMIEASVGNRGYSDIELREETLVIVIAGTDTTAVGISFTMLMLARHPHVQELVFKELQEMFGNSDEPVTAADLPRLKYLDAVVRETLRLYTPVPVIIRKIQKDLKLPSGITLVEGCGVVVHIWGTHRNPQYWGDDAEVFRPERFFDSPPKHPAAFMAFSYGPRNCLGYQYAMMSMKTALATLLRTYRISTSEDMRSNGCNIEEKPITLTFEVMMKDADRFTVQLDKRIST